MVQLIAPKSAILTTVYQQWPTGGMKFPGSSWDLSPGDRAAAEFHAYVKEKDCDERATTVWRTSRSLA